MTFTYDVNPSVYQTAHVASDYGVRDHRVDHYDWHGGVDYSSEAGKSLSSGECTVFEKVKTGIPFG